MAIQKEPLPLSLDEMRAIIWAHEVIRAAQVKMESLLEADDPFLETKKAIKNRRWSSNQRHKANRNKVTATDISEIVIGSGRNDFDKFANGTTSKLTLNTLDKFEEILPGTKRVFEVGPSGVPLWAALLGNITIDDFWLPLAKSGQAADTLEILSGSFDWAESDVDAPPKLVTSKTNKKITGMSLADALKYEAKNILPSLPLNAIVSSLMSNLSPEYAHQPQMGFHASMIETDRANLGIATLAIGVAKLAKINPKDLLVPQIDWHNPNGAPDYMEYLRQVLTGLIPFWQQFDEINGNAKTKVAELVSGLGADL